MCVRISAGTLKYFVQVSRLEILLSILNILVIDMSSLRTLSASMETKKIYTEFLTLMIE